jgi:hypothetical protein
MDMLFGWPAMLPSYHLLLDFRVIGYLRKLRPLIFLLNLSRIIAVMFCQTALQQFAYAAALPQNHHH